MSGRAWAAVAVLVALVLVFAPRDSPRIAQGNCAALEADAENVARQAALIVEAVGEFERILRRGARNSDARLLARLMDEFGEAAETHERQADRLARRMARVCGS